MRQPAIQNALLGAARLKGYFSGELLRNCDIISDLSGELLALGTPRARKLFAELAKDRDIPITDEERKIARSDLEAFDKWDREDLERSRE